MIENGLKMVKLCVIGEIRVCMKLGLGFMMKMVNKWLELNVVMIG